MERRSGERRVSKSSALRLFPGLSGARQTTNNTEVPNMKTILAAALAAATLVSAGGAAQAADKVKVGLLTCDVEGGLGYIIGSDKGLDCWFKPSNGGKSEHY